MNVEYIHYQVDAAQQSEFVTAFSQALALLDRDSTVLSYELVQNSDDPSKFVVRIEWQSRDSQRAYTAKEDFAAFLTLVKPYHGTLVSMQFHEPLLRSPKSTAAQ